jgi:hypothetical protein
MSEDQLLRAISVFPVKKRAEIIDSLKASSQAQIIERYGKHFWCALPSEYPETETLYKPSHP